MVESFDRDTGLEPLEADRALLVRPIHWDGLGRVALIGEIDLVSARDAEAILAPMASRGVPLILDLAGVTYCDSQGIAMFFRLAARARENGGHRLTLANPRGIVRRVLEITVAENVLAIVDDP